MKKGFTLIEAILYLAIAGVILYFISGFAFNAIFGKSKIETIQGVNQNARSVLDEMGNIIGNSISINGTTGGGGSGAGTTTEEIIDACGTSGDATDPDCWSIATSSLPWGTFGLTTNIQDLDTGATNTASLVDLGSAYQAAIYCNDLNESDHTDWYLPAKSQLWAGWNAPDLGSSTFPSASYWSSTEDSVTPAAYAWALDSQYNYMIFLSKNNSYTIRCLRQ